MSLPSIPEYSDSIKTPQMVHPQVLYGGHPIEKGVRLIKYSGGFCVVFPYETPTKKYAVRCWHAEVSDAKERTQHIAKALKNSGLPYFVGFDYYEDGIMTPQGLQPIIVMDWVEAIDLKKFLAKYITYPNIINEIAENFKSMVADLHRCHLSHGDLQHGNIMVKPDKQLILVDYDSMYVPALKGKSDEIKGLPGYQHLSRWKNQLISEKADYFSELVIFLSLKALAKMPTLWHELNMEETDTLVFSGEDIQSKGASYIFQRLRSDPELVPLVDRLCEFMSKPSIDELCPLEEAINFTPIDDEIAKGWKDGNGYQSNNSKGIIEDPSDIIKAWETGNGYNQSDDPSKRHNDTVTFISGLFKKPE